MIKFEVGKDYSMRSACYHDCVWTYRVIARTARTVTLEDDKGRVKKCHIRTCDQSYSEAVYPLGNYSMCPVLRAENVVKEMMMYKYGMRLRGYAPMCQPMKGLITNMDDPSGKYWDILFYNRKLTAREVNDYELDFIGEAVCTWLLVIRLSGHASESK